ncbi:unnamed protein product [Haemonchus placei]|uniref:Uncharacterized protein n=1 Tax=Haemonchus placei TaxID=6290 RepID=A0A3P7WZC3_HAEPC|nr:unnamed protein product [Haemonchus placei]
MIAYSIQRRLFTGWARMISSPYRIHFLKARTIEACTMSREGFKNVEIRITFDCVEWLNRR